MPLPLPAVPRQPLHHRSISMRGYRRDDGLFDIEGHLHDTKDIDFKVASGMRYAGDSIHSMWLRITLDMTLTIVAVDASTDAMPYPGHCNQITPDYKKLIGLAIRPGFTNLVRSRLGGIHGCTHITELVSSLATTAFQTIAGQGLQAPDSKPFQLDRCHALRSDGPAVARFYPKWYRGTPTGVPPAAEPDQH
ncbi:MAG: DUF2889 domain-containing protein [Betaproteobacteria bacterium]